MAIKIKNLKKKFNPIYWKHVIRNMKYIQIIYGGSSSGKSYSKAECVVLDVLCDKRNYLITRQVKQTVKTSVFNEVKEKISELRLKQFFKVNNSDLVITCVNGYQILFAGLDDVDKIKSIKPAKGVLTDIWMEEATENMLKSYKQLLKRLRGKPDTDQGNLIKRITMTYNPADNDHFIYQQILKDWWEDPFDFAPDKENVDVSFLDSDIYHEKRYQEHKNISILHTTYKDNLHLTEQDIELLEDEEDKYYFDVYTLGKTGVFGAVIFKNYRKGTYEEFNELGFDNFRNGLDWGYSKDPFAFVRVAIDLERQKIWVLNEIYETELQNPESAERVKEIIGNEEVWCDCAEPKSIAEYQNLDVDAFGVKKGAGSVEFGIKFLQRMEIIVHPDCPKTLMELKKYRWKEMKDGTVLRKPAERQADHLIDAIRYALESDMEETSIDIDVV